jgi:nucleoside-triphosphatase THEP1
MNTATIERAERAEIVDALPLGVLVYDNSIEGDRILAQAADILARSGLRLGGVVQSNIDRPGRRKCAMNLTDLTSGAVIAISQDLGEEARGCRLDTAALAQASLGVERALQGGVDLLIINKFGKQEALGQGFRPVIAEALMSDVPVVLGVSRLNLDACLDFAGGPVARLAPDPAAIVAWCRETVRNGI